ncbi:Pyruvate/Phosphoenolpyruvate kinase-like domain-containing protein [Naematelia encephala]|uniref:Pyruvate/Phosphoenolpyruvate kinase-like domain-containing protein n=1 Tax=Naematelia encephala TaxID=71784 RepID=A0A1Y2BD68_9TREE|nr:Pyruvate/Phosphoenolpyruvate kinase-like domain-containing protein [Naematelia encephala]
MSSHTARNIDENGEPLPFGTPAILAAFGIPPPPKQDPPMREFRGNTLAHPFFMKERMKLSREKPMMGIWYGAFPSIPVARAIGQAGFDFVLLDWEHTPYTIESVGELIKTISYSGEGDSAVIVRVPSHEHSYISWALDAGASAIILPHVRVQLTSYTSADESRQKLSNRQRPPSITYGSPLVLILLQLGGNRSFPPNAMLFGYNDGASGGGGGMEVWNRAAVILQIENELGAENADAMAAIDGADLGLEVGTTLLEMYGNPRWIAAVQKISAAAKKHNKAAFMPALFPQTVELNLNLGFGMLTCTNDGYAFVRALRSELLVGTKALDAWKEKNGNK